jgi:hypothetical protein
VGISLSGARVERPSSAALIGLLFIATSMHLGEVVSNPGFRVRSYNQTLYLLTLLVEAVLILVPQPVPFLVRS